MKSVRILATIALFLVSVGLVVLFQRQIGPIGAGMMLLGVAGLLVLLWGYNRRYR